MLKITHPATINRSSFYANILGAKLKNINWSWGAKAPATNCVFLNIWLDLMDKNNAEIFWHKYQTRSPGKPERLRHIDAIREGALGVGILCEVVDPNASPRKIKTFDDAQLLLLGQLSESDDHIYAPILKSFPIDELSALINNRAGHPNSVINDIPTDPIGFQVPGRKPVSGYQYQRDEKVRRHVIRQARGACEYCGEIGFLLPDGNHYLEAHHIIALAKQGPDTVNNVIALCPTDHREAHYGAKAVAMEEKMLQIIKHR